MSVYTGHICCINIWILQLECWTLKDACSWRRSPVVWEIPAHGLRYFPDPCGSWWVNFLVSALAHGCICWQQFDPAVDKSDVSPKCSGSSGICKPASGGDGTASRGHALVGSYWESAVCIKSCNLTSGKVPYTSLDGLFAVVGCCLRLSVQSTELIPYNAAWGEFWQSQSWYIHVPLNCRLPVGASCPLPFSVPFANQKELLHVLPSLHPQWHTWPSVKSSDSS